MKSIYRHTLLAVACTIAGGIAWAQSGDGRVEPASVEVAVTYNSVLANVTTGNEFWMQGGSAQAQGRLWRRVSIVADVAGLHTGNVNSSGVGLDLITVTFGPRYNLPVNRRILLFGHVLAGEAHGLDGQFPSSTAINSSGNSFALQTGGGINLRLTSHFSLRALDANWLRTQLPNATTNVQNNLRLGAGIIWRCK